jgi:hypothetical protein
MLAGDKSTLGRARAEVSFLLGYGRDVTIDNLQPQGDTVWLAGEDDSGKSFLLVYSKEEQWEVDTSLKYEAYVFLLGGEESRVAGWLPYDQLIEAKELDGKFVVSSLNLIGMPETLDLKSPCKESPCDEWGIWDYDTECWDCFACGRHRFCKADRDHISRFSYEVPEDTKGS